MGIKKFERTIENFTCEVCSHFVTGNGYTNHCPKCLTSKHVDNNPGDRNSDCHGTMKPIGVELRHGDYIITHECEKCGHKKRNKSSPEDDIDTIIQLSTYR